MRILVVCEYSGRVREAFRKRGHDAWSCDLLPCEDGSPYHYQCDVRDLLDEDADWDMIICFPDCTYLTGAAEWCYNDVQTKKKKPGVLYGAERRAEREKALDFVRWLLSRDVKRIVLENPVGVIGTRIMPATQIIQPYDFGDDASKKTCLWIKGVPKLVPTKRVPGRIVEWPPGSGKMVERWANQTDSGQNKLAPSDDRWKERSRTYQGIADAMAEQMLPPAKRSSVFFTPEKPLIVASATER